MITNPLRAYLADRAKTFNSGNEDKKSVLSMLGDQFELTCKAWDTEDAELSDCHGLAHVVDGNALNHSLSRNKLTVTALSSPGPPVASCGQ